MDVGVSLTTNKSGATFANTGTLNLAAGKTSGLIHVQKVLKKVKGVEFSYLNESDVVRHELVQKIIQAYEGHTKKRRR